MRRIPKTTLRSQIYKKNTIKNEKQNTLSSERKYFSFSLNHVCAQQKINSNDTFRNCNICNNIGETNRLLSPASHNFHNLFYSTKTPNKQTNKISKEEEEKETDLETTFKHKNHSFSSKTNHFPRRNLLNYENIANNLYNLGKKGEPQVALDVFNNALKHGLKPNTRLFRSILSWLPQESQQQQILSMLPRFRLEFDSDILFGVIHRKLHVENANKEVIFEIITEFEGRDIYPDFRIFYLFAQHLSRNKEWDELLEVAELFKSYGIGFDSLAANNKLKEMLQDGRSDLLEAAWEIFYDEEENLPTNATYSTIIQHLGYQGQKENLMAFYQEALEAEHVKKDIMFFTSVVRAAQFMDDFPLVQRILEDLGRFHIPPDSIFMKSVIIVFEHHNRWESIRNMFDQAKKLELKINHNRLFFNYIKWVNKQNNLEEARLVAQFFAEHAPRKCINDNMKFIMELGFISQNTEEILDLAQAALDSGYRASEDWTSTLPRLVEEHRALYLFPKLESIFNRIRSAKKAYLYPTLKARYALEKDREQHDQSQIRNEDLQNYKEQILQPLIERLKKEKRY